MDTIFINSGNRLLYPITYRLLNKDPQTSKEMINMLLYQILVFAIHGKI